MAIGTYKEPRSLLISISAVASHQRFPGQNKHLSDQIKLAQTNLLYIINGNFIEFVENNKCLYNFWSLSYALIHVCVYKQSMTLCMHVSSGHVLHCYVCVHYNMYEYAYITIIY